MGSYGQGRGPSPSQTASCFLNTSFFWVCFIFLFLFLPGYAVAEARVYKFLTLQPEHCSLFPRLQCPRPGILFDGLSFRVYFVLLVPRGKPAVLKPFWTRPQVQALRAGVSPSSAAPLGCIGKQMEQ